MSNYNGFNTLYHVPETGEYLYGDIARSSHMAARKRNPFHYPPRCSYVMVNGGANTGAAEDDGRRVFFSTKRGDFFTREKAAAYVAQHPQYGPVKEVVFYTGKAHREREAAFRKAEEANLRRMQEETAAAEEVEEEDLPDTDDE